MLILVAKALGQEVTDSFAVSSVCLQALEVLVLSFNAHQRAAAAKQRALRRLSDVGGLFPVPSPLPPLVSELGRIHSLSVSTLLSKGRKLSETF